MKTKPTKRCARCTLNKSIEDDFHKNARTKDGLQVYCKTCRGEIAHDRFADNDEAHARNNELQKQYNAERKRKCIEYYSGGTMHCAMCDWTDIRALTIDHMDGSGAKHRRDLKHEGRHIYGWLIKHGFPKGFQVLCMNHQFVKRQENGEYGRRTPHIAVA